MADVTPERPPAERTTAGTGRREDRGQLVLVSALSLAVLFVTLALLLNTAIYTGNLATRSVGSDSESVLEYHNDAVETTAQGIADANVHNNTSYTDLDSAIQERLLAWDAAAGHHHAVSGDDAEIRVDSTVNGTRLEQSTTRSFTNNSSAANWTVAEDATAYRDFTMTVKHDTTLVSMLDLGGNAIEDFANAGLLTVRVNASSKYTVFIGEDGENVAVTVFRPSGTSQCSADPGDDGEVTIDFSNGTVGGQPCDGLAFADDVDGPFELAIEDGDAAQGTYALVTDTRYGRYSEDFADHGSGHHPTRARALYAVNVSVSYRTPNTDYDAQVEVTPGAA